MLYAAALSAVWVLLQATGERSGAERTLVSTNFDITGMQPGDVQTVVWANKPLVIMQRLPEWQAGLSAIAPELLRDPDSVSSKQPEAARNTFRSSNTDWFVAIGLGTGTGCPLRFVAPSSKLYLDAPWPGGFIDTCDSTRYDLSGRVFRRQSAKKNVVVPNWRLEDGKIVVEG